MQAYAKIDLCVPFYGSSPDTPWREGRGALDHRTSGPAGVVSTETDRPARLSNASSVVKPASFFGPAVYPLGRSHDPLLECEWLVVCASWVLYTGRSADSSRAEPTGIFSTFREGTMKYPSPSSMKQNRRGAGPPLQEHYTRWQFYYSGRCATSTR